MSNLSFWKQVGTALVAWLLTACTPSKRENPNDIDLTRTNSHIELKQTIISRERKISGLLAYGYEKLRGCNGLLLTTNKPIERKNLVSLYSIPPINPQQNFFLQQDRLAHRAMNVESIITASPDGVVFTRFDPQISQSVPWYIPCPVTKDQNLSSLR
jgi:hypothetical protein